MYKIKIVIKAHITGSWVGLSNKRNGTAGKDYSEINIVAEECKQLY